MRAADRRIAVSASPDTSGLAVRLFVALVVAFALLWIWSPAVVHAQTPGSSASASQPGTFVVQKRPGESLHDIAVRLYGDSTRWRDIAAANGLATTNSRLLVETGKSIRIPGKTNSEISAANRLNPTVRTATTGARPAGSLAAQTAGKANADSAAAAAARRSASRPTTAANRSTASNTGRAAGTAGRGAQTSAQRQAAGQTAATTTLPAAVAASDSATRVANQSAAARAAVDERPIERTGVRIGLVSPAEMRAARGKDEPTIFMGRSSESEAEVRQAVQVAQQTRRVIAPRHGEYAAAPFPLEEVRFMNAGRVVRRLNGAGSVDADLPRNLSIADEAVVELPDGLVASVGQRFVAVNKGPLLSTGLYVAEPTGILEVVRADAGQPLLARVVRQSDIIEEGQSLVAFEGSAAPADLQRTIVTSDPVRGTVQFVSGDQLLPSLQSYLVIDATESQGVQQGDEFWLVERIGTGEDARERRIAVVRIVRTSPHGSTGIVIHQDRSGIDVGVAARRVARAGSGSGD